MDNDPRCIQVQETTKEMKANQTKERQKPVKNKNTSISLDSQIEALEAKPNRNQKEKEELRRLKNRRHKQKSKTDETPVENAARLTKKKEYMQEHRGNETPVEKAARLRKQQEYENEQRANETPQETAARLTKDKEYHHEQRANETPQETAARLTKDKEYHHEQRANETPQETAARLTKDKEYHQQNRIGGDAEKRLQMFKNRIRFGPSFPCITCHQSLFKSQVIEFDEKLKEVLEEKCSEPLFRRTLSNSPDNFYITIVEDKSQDYQITMMNRKKNMPLSNEGQEGNISTGPG